MRNSWVRIPMGRLFCSSMIFSAFSQISHKSPGFARFFGLLCPVPSKIALFSRVFKDFDKSSFRPPPARPIHPQTPDQPPNGGAILIVVVMIAIIVVVVVVVIVVIIVVIVVVLVVAVLTSTCIAKQLFYY